MKNNNQIKRLILSALFAALCMVSTAFLAFPLPTGYANLGDGFAFAAGFVLGMPWGIAAAGLGSALADLVLGYAIYMPATAILKALIAVAGAICARILLRKSGKFPLWAMLLCSLSGEAVMVLGYFVYECFVIGVGEAAVVSIPANVGQGAVGMLVSVALVSALSKIPGLRKLTAGIRTEKNAEENGNSKTGEK